MQRYTGQPLREGARVALIANDAIGNFVIATPLLQALRRDVPRLHLTFFNGERTRELWEASDLVDEGVPLFGMDPWDTAVELARHEGFDLVINLEVSATAQFAAAALSAGEAWVCGPSVGPGGRGHLPFPADPQGDLWRDHAWVAEDLPARYPFLRTGWIGEIFCRLAYREGDVPTYRVPTEVPGRPIPDVLIATAASLPEKLWPQASWEAALRGLAERGLSVGLLGAPVRQQQAHWQGGGVEDALVAQGLVEDLRGAFTLPQVSGALAEARAILSLDNGILHLAAATTTPVVGLFRPGIHRLWAPPRADLVVLTPGSEHGQVAEIDPATVLVHLDAAFSGISST